MISIFTFSLGRELYLKRLVESIRLLGGRDEFEHHLCFQGVSPTPEFKSYVDSLGSYPITVHEWDRNYGVCEGSNRIIPQLKGDPILKLDDDAVLRSADFIKHVRIISGLIPGAVFSAFPVGLIGHFGGITVSDFSRLERVVEYSGESDTYYTLRKTNLVGGLARACPAKFLKEFKWPSEQKMLGDGIFSKYCLSRNVPMFYLENALVVEHQESTLGQEERKEGRVVSNVKPKVSVVVTTYNREESVVNTLRSLSVQLLVDMEVIVVDDCSTDGTGKVVKDFIASQRRRFQYFKLDENHEYHSYSKNFGIQKTEAPYVAFLDDDDTYYPTALSDLHAEALKSKADVVYGHYSVRESETGKEANGVVPEFSSEALHKRNFIVTSSVIVKRSSLLAVGGFDESVSRFSDWHLWLRMLKNKCKFASIKEQVSEVCVNRPDSMSKRYAIYTSGEGDIVPHPYFDISLYDVLPKKTSIKVVVSEPVPVEKDVLVSIVIPVVNRPDLTKVCLDSIIKYTVVPYELILVQEGKDPEVEQLLKSYDAKYVQNKTPKGFAGAMNSGYEVSAGTHICFLNNDVVAIPNWLKYMMEGFDQGPKVGLVTPTYTETKSKQSIDLNDGKEFTHVDEPLSLKGVCFLISREALEKVGTWDESFGLGGGEDNDICIRIANAGYELIVARKSFIYHYGSAAFREVFNNDIPYSKKYSSKQFNKVRKKWGMDKKPRVHIAIPTFSGWIWHELELMLTRWSHSETFFMTYQHYPYLVPHDNARNQAVKDFLEGFWDYLVFIDDDIVPPPNTLDELLAANKDIIAPLCLTVKADNNNMTFPMPVAHRYDGDHHYRPYYGKGIEETDTVTGGMFMVRREVYEKLERPFYFTYHKDGTVEYSEDFVFAQQCQELGYKLYTHYDLICKHIKTLDVKAFNDALVVTRNQAIAEVRNIAA